MAPTDDQTTPSHALRVSFRGVSADSPLGNIGADALSGQVTVVFDEAPRGSSVRWRRIVRGTALQWWSEASQASRAKGVSEPADIFVDLHGKEDPPSGQTGRIWRVVDAAGIPLLRPFQALDVCHAEPYVASLHLIESEDAGESWHLVTEAHLSSAMRYGDLLDHQGRTSIRLLRAALRAAPSARRPWKPGAPARRRAFPMLRARRAAAARWLQDRFSGEIYGIARLEGEPDSWLSSRTVTGAHWASIPSSEGFVADPFHWPGKPGTILCELYTHRSGLGRLVTLSLDSRRITGIRPISFGLTGHLSYPFSWSEGGRVYCLPEMATSGRQVLYELRQGEAATPVCVIAENVRFADATVMKTNGLYWLAYTDMDIGYYDNLCLMHAHSLEGPWHAHRGNPVKIDARSSRSGGMPFQVGRELFRPAQDCSRTYGGALVINHVKVCTLERYGEEPVAVFRPDPSGPYPDGLHHFSKTDGYAVIDGKRISYHPRILFNKFWRRMTRGQQ